MYEQVRRIGGDLKCTEFFGMEARRLERWYRKGIKETNSICMNGRLPELVPHAIISRTLVTRLGSFLREMQLQASSLACKGNLCATGS